MKDSSRMVIDKGKVNTHGLIRVIIRANGYVIKWMVEGFMSIPKLNFKDTSKMTILSDH